MSATYLRFNFFLLLVLGLTVSVFAQNERTLTRDGNTLFEKGNYTDAEASYKKALDKKNNYPEAIFNLGDAIYKQPNRKEEAVTQFELANKLFTDPKIKAQCFHNIGNAYIDAQKYEQAVKAYKEALKLNPKDNDTKYNLAFANEKLRTQNNENQNKDDKQDQNKDDQKDKKDDQKQDKKDDQKDQNKEGDNKDKQDQKDDKKEGQAPKPKLSKEAAEKLLQALQNEEQKTNEKMQQKQGRPIEVKIEKDW